MTMTTKKTRTHRTIEERIADKEAELASLKSRQRWRELRDDPGVKTLVATAKAIDRAAAVAEERESERLERDLAKARKTLAEYLDELGIQAPWKRLLEAEDAA
jgi:hypothetical protein